MGRSHSLSSIPYFAPDPASDSIDSSDDRAKRAEARKQAYDQAFTAGLYDYGHGQASTPEPKIKKKECECKTCGTCGKSVHAIQKPTCPPHFKTGMQCIKCAYEARNCTRCFTGRKKAACTSCARCNKWAWNFVCKLKHIAMGLVNKEPHECSWGDECACLGRRTTKKCTEKTEKGKKQRRLASRPRYRDSPV